MEINLGPSDTTMATYALRRVAQLPAHDDRAWHIAWNPTSPLLATCSADKTVRVYHYRRKESGEIEFTLIREVPTGHTKTVRAVAWSPSGGTLATASFDSTIGVWVQDRGEWECVSTLEGHENECKGVGYSCTGTLMATCSRDKTVWIWEGEGEREVMEGKTNYRIVLPDHEFECASVLMEHTQDVKCVAWHPSEEVHLLFYLRGRVHCHADSRIWVL